MTIRPIHIDQLALFDAAADATIAYYDRVATQYAEQTAHVDFSAMHKRFLALTPTGPILDAGSGGGRDTLAFLEEGRVVDAFDASLEMAKLSSARTGVTTDVQRFETFRPRQRYAGIWACASLLHVAQHQLSDAVARLAGALLPAGVLFMSFKYGDEQRVTEDGRRFTDLNEASLGWLIRQQPKLSFDSMWKSQDVLSPNRPPWLNALTLRKTRASTRSV